MADMTLSQVRQLAGEKGYLRSVLELGLDTAGGPPIYHLASGLSALSVALCYGDAGYSHFLDPLQPLYPHLNEIFLGPTGAGKTRSQRVGQSLLSKALPDALLPNDFSREGLYDTLAQRPYGLLFVDEFKGFQERLSRDYNAGAREFLTESYDSPPLIKRKLKSGEVEIRFPRISLITGSTVEWFEEAIRGGDFEGGWLARFLFFIANEVPPLRRPSSQNVGPVVESLVEHLQEVSKLSGPANFNAVEDQAWPWMESNHNAIVNVESAIRGFQARINTHAVKLAMLFHVSDCPTDLDIRPEDWSRAVLLIDTIKKDVRTLISEVAFDKTGKALNGLRRIILKNDGIDKRSALQNSNMKARDFEGYLETLRQTGEVHTHTIANPRGRATLWIEPGDTCQRCQRNGFEEWKNLTNITNVMGHNVSNR